jgi:hypothetical protein
MLTEKLFYFRLIYSIQTGYVDYKSFVFSWLQSLSSTSKANSEFVLFLCIFKINTMWSRDCLQFPLEPNKWIVLNCQSIWWYLVDLEWQSSN